jgi:uncharacterized protein YkvS
MLTSETNIQHKKGSEKEPSVSSQIEVVDYIHGLALGLQKMAQNSGLVTLAYMLSMVSLAAEEMAEEHRKPDV